MPTLHRVALFVLALAAVTLLAEVGMAIFITDDTILEIAKAETKLARNREKARWDADEDKRRFLMSSSPAPRFPTDAEIDAGLARPDRRAEVVAAGQAIVRPAAIKLVGAGLFTALAWAIWARRKGFASILAVICGGLAAWVSFVLWPAEVQHALALYGYFDSAAHLAVTLAKAILIPLAALLCFLSLMPRAWQAPAVQGTG